MKFVKNFSIRRKIRNEIGTLKKIKILLLPVSNLFIGFLGQVNLFCSLIESTRGLS